MKEASQKSPLQKRLLLLFSCVVVVGEPNYASSKFGDYCTNRVAIPLPQSGDVR